MTALVRSQVRLLLLSSSLLVIPFLVWPGVGDYSVVKWLGIYVFTLWLAPLAWQGKIRLNGPALALLLFALLSLSWSPDPREGFLRWLNLASLYGVFLVVWITRIRIAWPLLAIAGVAAGVLLPESHGTMGNENFLSHFLILTVPFCLTKKWWPAALLTLGFIILKGSSEVFLVLGVGYVWGVYFLYRRWGGFILLMGILVPINIWTYWQPDLSSPLWVVGNRAELWINSLAVFLHHPWGTGLGGFNYYYPQFDEVHRQFFENNLIGAELKLFAGAAHNEWLQLLVVLGPVGVFLAGWFFLSIYPKGDWRLQAAFIIVLLIGSVNFPFQLPASGLLAACILGLCARSRSSRLGLESQPSGETRRFSSPER